MEFIKENDELIKMINDNVDYMDDESIEDLSKNLSTYSRMMLNSALTLDIDDKSKRELTVIFKNYEFIMRNLGLEYISLLRERINKLNNLIG